MHFLNNYNWERSTTGCILSLCLFNLCTEYNQAKCWSGWSTGWNQDCWEKYQQPQICRLEELKSFFMRVKEESEKVDLKLNIRGGPKMDGRGIGWGDHFLPHKFIKRTFQCLANSTNNWMLAEDIRHPERQPMVFENRVHLEKCWTGWSTSWNQDCQEKYQ